MAIITPPGYQQASSYAAADDRRNITTALAQRSILDLVNTGARGGWVAGKLPAWSASGWNVTVGPGVGVVENGFASNAGEYTVFQTANQLLTHTASSGTLNRIDVVGVQVDDAYYSGILNDANLVIIQGTPVAGTPTSPALPATFLPVYSASIPAGSSTPTISDLRKSTVAAGGVNPVVWATQAGDIGGFNGEQRWNPNTGALEYWNSGASAWRGTPTSFRPPTTRDAVHNQSFTLTALSTVGQIAHCAIPDPGWPYDLVVSGHCGGISLSVLGRLAITLDNVNQWSVTPIAVGYTTQGYGIWEACIPAYCTAGDYGAFTGAHTAYLSMALVAGTTSSFNVSSDNSDMTLTVQVYPR